MPSPSTIEANSLTSITELAAHPPRYPRNPTEEKRPPLVLYIARVPGCQDVILTTMKPGLKNLTAEDVASSLYYLHRDVHISEDSFSDAAVAAENPPRTPSERLLIARKPVGSEIHRKFIRKNPSPDQASTGLYSPNIDKHRMSLETDLKSVERKQPLGPRPMSNQQIRHTKMPALDGRSDEENLLAIPDKQPTDNEPLTIPPLPPRPTFQPAGKYPDGAFKEAQLPSLPITKSFKTLAEPPPISVTLIRRDPTSGAQWNIGKLCGQPVSSLEPPSVTEKSPVLASISLTTPGYSPFYESSVPQSSSAETPMGSEITQKRNVTQVRPIFSRQVLTEWSGSWDRSFRTRRRGSSDPGLFGHPPPAAEDPLNAEYSKSNKSRLRAYVFHSPWNGRCELTTGNGGRVLKCKHTLPDNAAVPNSQPVYTGPGVTVSELRFNLPTASLFKGTFASSTSPESGRPRRPTLTHIRNKMSGESSRPASTTPHPTSYAAMYPSEEDEDNSDEYEDERYGLSLGQEKAGGGNRGKRTKLGKLIIYEEGYKMLDLIVAANMSIWWSIWEKE